jgi:hypothetical protein
MQGDKQITLRKFYPEKILTVFFGPLPNFLIIGMFSGILPHIIGNIEPEFND